MKVNIDELSGEQLDWAVAKCKSDDTLAVYFDEETGEPLCHDDWQYNQEFKPTTDWSQGGPIIEQEGMSLEFRPMGSMHEWVAFSGDEHAGGETPLIAAMRCYVASKLGYEIDLPVKARDHEQDCPAMDGFGCRCKEEQ